ncbi:hypothetical protein [Rickettsia endosymbiont of Proechinophthirus fluctus]|nr:hypothetical protein [Rickettsia endosymbiont of Proechinophthirus fluctus]
MVKDNIPDTLIIEDDAILFKSLIDSNIIQGTIATVNLAASL